MTILTITIITILLPVSALVYLAYCFLANNEDKNVLLDAPLYVRDAILWVWCSFRFKIQERLMYLHIQEQLYMGSGTSRISAFLKSIPRAFYSRKKLIDCYMENNRLKASLGELWNNYYTFRNDNVNTKQDKLNATIKSNFLWVSGAFVRAVDKDEIVVGLVALQLWYLWMREMKNHPDQTLMDEAKYGIGIVDAVSPLFESLYASRRGNKKGTSSKLALSILSFTGLLGLDNLKHGMELAKGCICLTLGIGNRKCAHH